MYNVLFISFVNWDSLMEIPALLESGGCTVDLFCTKNSWVLDNKSFKNAYLAESDAETFTEKLLSYLQLYKNNYQWIIPGDDIIIRILNEKITDENLFHKIMPLTKIENRELLGSKAGFSELCNKYDIRTPKYLVYNDKMSPDDIIEEIGFPMMVKLDKSEGGFGIYKCDSREDLIATVTSVTDRKNMVFQQFIKGYEVNTELLTKDGNLIVYNYSRRLKTLGKFGVSTQRAYSLNNDLEIELKHISKSFGLNGFGNVVFMYSETENRYYLIEVDIRPNSWMYYGKFTGNDFALGIRKIINGDNTLLAPKKYNRTKETFVALYKKDVYRCIVEKDFVELARWALNFNNRWRFVPSYDARTLNSVNRFLITTFKTFFFQKVQRGLHIDLANTFTMKSLRIAK